MRRNKSSSMSLLALLFVTLALASGDKQQDSVSTRIIGGTPAEPGEFPSMAALYGLPTSERPLEFKCGGSVIDRRHILTAAHCAQERSLYAVKLGCHNLTECTDSVYQIEDFKIHPLYRTIDQDSITYAVNDIAILRTDRPIKFTQLKGLGSVGPISVANSIKYEHREGNRLTVVGWGRAIPSSSNTTDILHKASLEEMSPAKCKIRFESTNTAANFCTKSPEWNTSATSICERDFGGPLIGTLPDGSKQQVGIVGMGFCESNYIGLFTRVSAFIDWIEECKNIWNNQSM